MNSNELRAALDRAEDRHDFARRELARAEYRFDNGDFNATRSLNRLQQDVDRAETDVRVAKSALERMLASGEMEIQ